MFGLAEWTSVSAQVGGVLVTLSGVYVFLKKQVKAHPQLAKDIEEKLPHDVVVAVEDAGKFVERIASSPFFAGEAAKGKIEAQHVLGKFADSEAARVAAQVLQAFGRGYSDLSKNEQNAAVIMARTELSKLGLNITDAQIEGALNGAAKAVNDLQALGIFKAVQDLAGVNTQPAQA